MAGLLRYYPSVSGRQVGRQAGRPPFKEDQTSPPPYALPRATDETAARRFRPPRRSGPRNGTQL